MESRHVTVCRVARAQSMIAACSRALSPSLSEMPRCDFLLALVGLVLVEILVNWAALPMTLAPTPHPALVGILNSRPLVNWAALPTTLAPTPHPTVHQDPATQQKRVTQWDGMISVASPVADANRVAPTPHPMVHQDPATQQGRVTQWDGMVSVGPPEADANRVTALLLSCRDVIRPPLWSAAFIVASREYASDYIRLADEYGGGHWSVLIEEDMVKGYENASLRPSRGWDRQQDAKLAFLLRKGPSHTVLFDADSLCSCSHSWERYAQRAANTALLDVCLETSRFEPARSNMVATAHTFGIAEAGPALVGWTPQVLSRAMFQKVASEHHPNLLREALEKRLGPECTLMANLPAKSRFRNRCWTEYFVYQLLGLKYGYWDDFHNSIPTSYEDGGAQVNDPRCAHLRVLTTRVLAHALRGRMLTAPFIMLDDHNPDFSAGKVLSIVQNTSFISDCAALGK